MTKYTIRCASDDPKLFIGLDYRQRFPVIVAEKLLCGHCWITGATGGGKTVMITSLLVQLLERGVITDEEPIPSPQQRKQVAMVVIDAKGDMFQMEMVRKVALRNGQRFRLFTPEHLRHTEHFVPFASLRTAWRTPIELCQIVLNALALDFGSGYGRSFFSGVSRSALLQAIKHPSNPQTFEDLYRILRVLQKGQNLKDCLELLNAIETLMQYPQLKPNEENPEAEIEMASVIKDGEVVYFWLPPTEPVATREIARLAIHAIFTAARDRQRQGLPPRQCYVICDELQRVIARSLDVTLQQARSSGISLILANQSEEDLRTPDGDLRSVLRTNTRVQMHFSVTDFEAKRLSAMSGEVKQLLKSVGTTQTRHRLRPQHSQMISYNETWRPRLTVEDILRICSDPQGMMLCLQQEGESTHFEGRPVPVRTLYPTTLEEYQALSNAPWPEPEKNEGILSAAPRRSLAVTKPEPKPEEKVEDSLATVMEAVLSAEIAELERIYG